LITFIPVIPKEETKMKRACLSLLVVLAVAVAWPSRTCAEQIFSATLTQDQTIPPSGSPATAFGTFTLNDTMTMLAFNITYSGLEANATVLHFHDAPRGVGGPVVRAFPLPSTTSGELTGVWSSTDAQPLTPALVAELEIGNLYVDIHTTAFPKDPQGELRGQLTSVPEPSSLVLVGLGTLSLFGYRWLRRGQTA
jgi:hypothetical protein